MPVIYVFARRRAAKPYADEITALGRRDLRAIMTREPVFLDMQAVGSTTGKGNVATGMAYDGAWLYMVEESVAARIPWSPVRSWRWHVEGHSETRIYATGGLQTMGQRDMMQIRANLDNLRRFREAYRNSEFFVQVADVQEPVWQFMTEDLDVLRRCEEVLTQINEGRLYVS